MTHNKCLLGTAPVLINNDDTDTITPNIEIQMLGIKEVTKSIGASLRYFITWKCTVCVFMTSN